MDSNARTSSEDPPRPHDSLGPEPVAAAHATTLIAPTALTHSVSSDPALPRSPPPGYLLAAGARLGASTLIRPLGRGGMGEVWLARHETSGRLEAIKVLLHLGATAIDRERF